MAAHKAQNISPTELVDRRRSGELWRLLDVREPWEIEIASVPDALVIPMSQLAVRISELDNGAPVAVICHSGGRSARVADWLVDSGFEAVANIEGGIDAWSMQIDGKIPRY